MIIYIAPAASVFYNRHMKVEFGQVIRQIREKAVLSQQDVADALGVDVGNVSRYENGTQGMTFDRLSVLSTALKTPLSEMFARAESGGRRTAAPATLEQTLETLSEYLMPIAHDIAARRRAGGLLADLAEDPASHTNLAGILRAVIDSANRRSA